jgi:hypothetical protein
MKAAASLALLGAIFISLGSAVAVAQTAGRLSRPVQPSAMGPDGKLHIARDATFGNLAVDIYSDLGRQLYAAEGEPESYRQGMKKAICLMHGRDELAAARVAEALKGMSKDERARLKSRDAASLTELSIKVVAVFDGVSADAIRSDEALGPGAYHDAINGFRVTLDACHFFGLERRL